MTCPRCEGSGQVRTTVRATKPGERDTHPEVICSLCRGTGQAPGWDRPLSGAPAPQAPQRDAS